jgi:hypothetical protein
VRVRFYFRGLYRDSGKAVDGHVDALDAELAYQVLAESGIVTESLREAPLFPVAQVSPTSIPDFAHALESALNESSSQVAFDDLTARYRGKKVWVIDREQIRYRVAEVVDATLAASEADSESNTTARQRVANAISGLFHDTRNIASQRSAESIAAMRLTGGGGAYSVNSVAGMSDSALAEQIGRLTGVVEQAEGLIAAMKVALQAAESGGVPRRHMMVARSTGPEQSEVLREIFQSNLELRRAMANPSATPPLKVA